MIKYALQVEDFYGDTKFVTLTNVWSWELDKDILMSRDEMLMAVIQHSADSKWQYLRVTLVTEK